MTNKKEVELSITIVKHAIKKLLGNDTDYTPKEKRESLIILINNLYNLEKKLSEF